MKTLPAGGFVGERKGFLAFSIGGGAFAGTLHSESGLGAISNIVYPGAGTAPATVVETLVVDSLSDAGDGSTDSHAAG